MPNNQSAIELLRFMFAQVHAYVEATMSDVSDDVARHESGRPANILEQYAH